MSGMSLTGGSRGQGNIRLEEWHQHPSESALPLMSTGSSGAQSDFTTMWMYNALQTRKVDGRYLGMEVGGWVAEMK